MENVASMAKRGSEVKAWQGRLTEADLLPTSTIRFSSSGLSASRTGKGNVAESVKSAQPRAYALYDNGGYPGTAQDVAAGFGLEPRDEYITGPEWTLCPTKSSARESNG